MGASRDWGQGVGLWGLAESALILMPGQRIFFFFNSHEMTPCILGLSTVSKGRLYRTAVKPAIGRAAQTKAVWLKTMQTFLEQQPRGA